MIAALCYAILGVYLTSCFVFHLTMLQFYKNDTDPDLAKVPKWVVHTFLVVASLFWPIVYAVVCISKKEDAI